MSTVLLCRSLGNQWTVAEKLINVFLIDLCTPKVHFVLRHVHHVCVVLCSLCSSVNTCEL